MKLTRFWQQLMLRLALSGAVLAVCFTWVGLAAPVSAETMSAPAVSLSPNSMSFGNHPVNTISPALTATLKNSGDAALSIKGIGLSGPNSADFHQENACPSGSNTLAPGVSCTISVTFTPKAEGNFSASLSVADNASDSPQTVALSGSGTAATAPVASLSPTSLSFGNHTINTTSSAHVVTLTNTGGSALSIKGIGLSGPNANDFHQQNTCPSGDNMLAPGAHCTINVTFTPTAEANFSASLSVADNAAGSPQSVALSGTGVPGMPPTGSDPNALPPADTILHESLGWLVLILAVLAALGIGTEFISGTQRRPRAR